MESTITGLDTFLKKQVDMWLCSSIEEAQETLIGLLVEKEIDEKIARWKADFKAGRYRTINKKSNAEFVSRLEKKYLSNKGG